MGNRLWWNVNSNIVFVLTNKAISKANAIILVCRNRFKQENEPIMQMWTSELAMSEFPLRTEFPVFWEFLGILKNSQLCKWPLQTEFPVFWEFSKIPNYAN